MLFTEKKSALVRLSDSIKVMINECYFTTEEIIELYEKNRDAFEELQSLARKTLTNDNLLEDFDEKAEKLISKIPENVFFRGEQLQMILHGQSMQVVLTSCFVLESYINSLSYFLFKQEDYLGLIRAGHETTADIILTSIDKMNALEKWDSLGRFNTGNSFDKSRAPFQNCKIIFNFRNDIVHDKVTEYSNDRAAKNYNNLLPDPVIGMLDLTHANFAAQTYWDMIIEIHKLLNCDIQKFHRHYNLMPWYDQDHQKNSQKLGAKYKKLFL